MAVDWRSLLSGYSDWDIDTMMAIIFGSAVCPNGESGGDPTAINPDGRSWGGLQIEYDAHRAELINITGSDDPHQLLNPIINVEMAHDVWLSSGYGAWSCYR